VSLDFVENCSSKSRNFKDESPSISLKVSGFYFNWILNKLGMGSKIGLRIGEGISYGSGDLAHKGY